MDEMIQKIDRANHVTLIVHSNPSASSLGAASALYTYILTLHKKVSFFCESKKINQKFHFLPWVEKIRDTFPSSADLAIVFECGDKNSFGVEIACDLIHIASEGVCLGENDYLSSTQFLYNLFRNNGIKINAKMATALYGGVLYDSDAFMSEGVDGTTFAMARELLEAGAEYKVCNKFITKYTTLGAFRLKGIMYANMILVHDAKVATFCVTNLDLKASGALEEDSQSVLRESLYLPSVEVAFLLQQNFDFTLSGFLLSNAAVDVAKIALQLGGKGHAREASFVINKAETLEKEKAKILKLIDKEM